RTMVRITMYSQPQPRARENYIQHGEGRHKRVWNACVRCRLKKIKCSEDFPCKRCKEEGSICTPGTRRKKGNKILPPRYVEMLENSHLTLIATIQKLYLMVRNGEPWRLEEPERNDCGQPIVHSIAAKLGCLYPGRGSDSPFCPTFSDDKKGTTDLAQKLQQHVMASCFDSTLRNSSISTSSEQIDLNIAYNQPHHVSFSTMSGAKYSNTDPELDKRVTLGSSAIINNPTYESFLSLDILSVMSLNNQQIEVGPASGFDTFHRLAVLNGEPDIYIQRSPAQMDQ
ncbi:hypothetical protein C7999DRAFT_18462, partial [Corynascus novoguineensis]